MVAGDRQGAFGSDESERLYGFAICLALGVACTLLPLENGRRVVNVRTADLGCFLPRDRNWPVCRYRMPVPSAQQKPPGRRLDPTGQSSRPGRADGQDALRVDQARVAQIVQPSLAEDLGSGLEPHGLAELHAVPGQKLREDAAQSAEHGPPAVNHLQLTVLGERLRVGREPGGVPPVVAGELAGEVARGLAGEWAQVLNPVRAVPRAARRNGLRHGLPHGKLGVSGDLSGGRRDLDRLSGEGGRRKSHCGSSHGFRIDGELTVVGGEDSGGSW
nr:Chloroa_b-bind domain-containing protein [Ipomoea batatas]GMD05347.1 Chloroa_b-bind domain-containing protein [Ipomoea batatas]